MRTVESTLGAFFAFVVGLVVVVFGGNLVYIARGHRAVYLIALGALAGVGMEVWFLARLKDALEAGVRPLPPRLALAEPRWPLLLRPVVFAWWLAHYALALAAVFLIEQHFPLSAWDWDLGWRLVAWTAFAAALFTTTHSANLYLLLALGTFWRRPGLLMGVWRWRVPLDVLVALVAAVVATQVR